MAEQNNDNSSQGDQSAPLPVQIPIPPQSQRITESEPIIIPGESPTRLPLNS